MSYIGRTPTNAALTASDLADGIVTTAKIDADAVTDAKIADDVVGTEHLTANEVDTAALGADAVTGAQLADNAVNSEHYTDGSIDTAHLADGQVTVGKLATAVLTGATDIGAAIADADLFLVDDGAGGTLRKTAASRLKTYINNTPTFRAFVSGNAFTLANGADTTVVFNGISFNPQSTFNGSNGRFTPGVSGKYFLHATVRLSATNDQGIFDIYLRKNSSTVASNRVRGSGTGNLGITISDVVESDTDDYFYIQIYQASGGDITASIDTVSYFTGYKIIE